MTKKRILVAEDDAALLKATKVRLEHEGYHVITAVDGEDVLQQAASELPIHLIVLDIKMPKLDGYEVCQRLKRQPGTAAVPIIVVTGWEPQLSRLADRCIEVGAEDWLQKPYHAQELLAKIHRALGEGEQEGSHG